MISEYTIVGALQEELENRKIKYNVYEYDKLPGQTNIEGNRVLSNLMLKDFEERRIDYCFSFGAHILSGDLLERYKFRIINFHPTLLLMYPGVKAIDQPVRHDISLIFPKV